MDCQVVEEEEEVTTLTTLSIGETFQIPEISLTVSEAIITDSYEYYDEASDSMLSKEADPGISFLIITLEGLKSEWWLKGTGPWERRFNVSDSEGNTCVWSAYLGEDRLTLLNMYPGMKIEGKMLFKIQEGASGLKITYTLGTPYPFPITDIAEWVIK